MASPQVMRAEPLGLRKVRLFLVCFAALSVSFPMAWVSMAKILLVLGGLACLALGARSVQTAGANLWRDWMTPRWISAALVAFTISFLWTEVDMAFAATAWIKHAKWITVVLLMALIKSPKEARSALIAFAIGQGFLIVCAWLMVMGVPLPWVTSTAGKYVVFSTYLDQSIMFASTAGILWHLRDELIWPRWLSLCLAAAAVVHTLFFLEGRTGYVVALAVAGFAVMWHVPKKLRWPTMILAPVVALAVLSMVSMNFKQRIGNIVSGSQDFAGKKSIQHDSSEAWRLNAWHRSVQAIAAKPIFGVGVGSWTPTVKRFEGAKAIEMFGPTNSSNPHQEYLLWGVEIGIGGVALLVGLLCGIAWDAGTFKPGIARATWSATLATGVACLFNSSLYDDLMGDYLCVTIGLLLAYGLQMHRAQDSPSDMNLAQGSTP